ncbi:MAG: nuclease A inhibitor family protein [Pyrinomonadaceae bacterium]|nr:nuclease A inhibitor family protein [Pyrinomonadaceae bacterium]
MSGKKGKAVIERIAKACLGLVYISETDSEVEAVSGGRADSVSEAAFRSSFKFDKDLRIEQADPNEFFERLTRQRDWHTEPDRANAAGFARLEAVMEEELKELRVFRVGNVSIDIYVVGSDHRGRMMGVRMHAVET